MEWSQLLCGRRRSSQKGNTGERDLRAELEKDYKKIIMSAAFRRLQDKTQVFPLDKSDFIRTRLTHSMEVSAIASSLGHNIGRNILAANRDPNFTWQMMNNMCSVLQSAGLIHDIGNPPFGHFGETAIRQWFQENLSRYTYYGKKLTDILSQQMLEDLYQFEGNAQGIRQVTKLHYLADEYGMDLTYSVLSTIIKYPRSSVEAVGDTRSISKKKMGYFYADQDVFDDIQRNTGTMGKRNPMTFILEAADDIAYKTADIEDAVKKGCITYGMLAKGLERWKRECDKSTVNYFDAAGLLNALLCEGISKECSNPELYAVQNWLVDVQNFLIRCATYGFVSHYNQIMAGEYEHDLFWGTHAEKLVDFMGEIAYDNAFISEPIYKLEIAAGHMLEFLLEKFVGAVIYFDTDKTLGTIDEKLVYILPENYRERYYKDAAGKDEAQRLYLRILLATDCISGMTDGYARSLYQELNGMI